MGGVIGKMDGFFANLKQKIRIAHSEGQTHGAVSHPCLPSFLPSFLPTRPARDDVMSCMLELLLLPGYLPSVQPEDERRSVGRMTIYNAYYHILVGPDLSGAEQIRAGG